MLSYWNFLFINITLLENYDFSSENPFNKLHSVIFSHKRTDCFSLRNSIHQTALKKALKLDKILVIAAAKPKGTELNMRRSDRYLSMFVSFEII